jgi:hypothetical protein
MASDSGIVAEESNTELENRLRNLPIAQFLVYRFYGKIVATG